MWDNQQKETLPAPLKGEYIEAYLDRIGFHYAKLYDADDVLCVHENYNPDATLDENHAATGISPELAERVLNACRSFDASGEAEKQGHELIKEILEEELLFQNN